MKAALVWASKRLVKDRAQDGAGIWRLGAELCDCLCVYLVPVVYANGLCVQI